MALTCYARVRFSTGEEPNPRRARGVDPKKVEFFVVIYAVPAEREGWLYDQLNFDQKPPQRAVGIALNPHKTPARRFVDRLMHSCPVFWESEVETRSNNIGRDSRKLTTNSTLVGAADEFKKLLVSLEEDRTDAYDALVKFTSRFFSEYANHFPAIKPRVTGEERNKLRRETYAISNVMFHALVRVAKDFWMAYRNAKRPWEPATATEWRDFLAMIAGTDPTTGRQIMSRENPAWVGKIVIEKFGPSGVIGSKISNTRDTRDAAYEYLVSISAMSDFLRRTERRAA